MLAPADEGARHAVVERVVPDVPAAHLVVQVHGLDGDALHAAALRVADVLKQPVTILIAAVDNKSVRLLPACVEGPLTQAPLRRAEGPCVSTSAVALLTVSEDS